MNNKLKSKFLYVIETEDAKRKIKGFWKEYFNLSTKGKRNIKQNTKLKKEKTKQKIESKRQTRQN